MRDDAANGKRSPDGGARQRTAIRGMQSRIARHSPSKTGVNALMALHPGYDALTFDRDTLSAACRGAELRFRDAGSCQIDQTQVHQRTVEAQTSVGRRRR